MLLENKNFNIVMMLILLVILNGCSSGSLEKNKGPIVTANTPEFINENEAAEFSVTATDSDGTIRDYKWIQFEGPKIEFTMTENRINFIAPEVSEDTPIAFLVNVSDNIGAVTQIQIHSTILNLNKTNKTNLLSKNVSVTFFELSSDKKNVPLNILATIEFDQPMTTESLVGKSNLCDSGIQLTADNFKSCLPLNVISESKNKFTLEFGNSLKLSQAYEIKITAAAKSVDGHTANDVFVSSFTTESNNLTINEISSSLYWDDNRWIEIYNGTNRQINLADYLIRSNSFDYAKYKTADIQVFQLTEKVISPGEYVVINDIFSQIYWSFEMSQESNQSLMTSNKDKIRPYWEQSGFVELLSITDATSVDFVRFGNNKQMPLVQSHWQSKQNEKLDYHNIGKSFSRNKSNVDSDAISDWQFTDVSTPGKVNVTH